MDHVSMETAEINKTASTWTSSIAPQAPVSKQTVLPSLIVEISPNAVTEEEDFQDDNAAVTMPSVEW